MKWIRLLWAWSTKDSGGTQFKNVGFHWGVCGAQFLWCTQKKGTSKPFWHSKWILMRLCGLHLISSFTSKGWVFMQPSFLHAHSVLIASSVSASLPHLLMCDYNFHNHWNHYNSQGLLLWRSLQAYIAKNFNCACLNNVDLEAPYLDLNSPCIFCQLFMRHQWRKALLLATDIFYSLTSITSLAKQPPSTGPVFTMSEHLMVNLTVWRGWATM